MEDTLILNTIHVLCDSEFLSVCSNASIKHGNLKLCKSMSSIKYFEITTDLSDCYDNSSAVLLIMQE